MQKFKGLLFLFTLLLFPYCQIGLNAQVAPGSELAEGFRDFKWGMPTADVPNTYIEIEVSKKLQDKFGERDFVKQGVDLDHLTVSGILANQIRYVFFFDRFGGVSIEFPYADRETVTKVMEERFGSNAKIDKGIDFTKRMWTGEKTIMNLTVNEKYKYVRFDVFTQQSMREVSGFQSKKEREKEDKIKALSKERF